MTTLIKLGIQGVRSFNPDTPEILEFEKPVTLIVGQNGAGKTTIIECLKMVAAGQLPPNCEKGHGFIHDPNLARTPEVKGQIRLLFRSPNNHQICVIRSFQLTNTKAKGSSSVKSTFRALEGIVKTREIGGAESSVTKKCADMDALVPALMGVSRAVLDSVIFCHQEEANWPLTEKIALKKKFDDIFGSARYTKALEAIEKSRKEYMKDSREKLHAFELLEKDAIVDKSLNAEAARLIACRDELMATSSSLGFEIDKVQVNLSHWEAQDSKQAEARFLLAQKESTVANLKQELEETSSSLPEVFTEPVDRLRSHLINLETQRVPEAAIALASARHALQVNSEETEKIAKALSEYMEIEDASVSDNLKGRLGATINDLSKLTGLHVTLDSNVEEILTTAQVNLMQFEIANSRKEASARESVDEAERNRFLASAERDRLKSLADQVLAVIEILNREKLPLEEKTLAGANANGAAVDAADAEDELAAIEMELEAAVELRGKLRASSCTTVHSPAESGESLPELHSKLARHREHLEELRIEEKALFASSSSLITRINQLQAEIDTCGDKTVRASHFQKIIESQKELAMAECAKVLYGKMKDKSLEKSKCQFCKRKLQGEGDLQTFTAAVDDLTSQLPKLLLELSARLHKAHTDYAELVERYPLFYSSEQLDNLKREVLLASEQVRGCHETMRHIELSRPQVEKEISDIIAQLPGKGAPIDSVSAEDLEKSEADERRLRQARSDAAAKFASLNAISQRAQVLAESAATDLRRLNELQTQLSQQQIAFEQHKASYEEYAERTVVAEQELKSAVTQLEAVSRTCQAELRSNQATMAAMHECVGRISSLKRELAAASEKAESGSTVKLEELRAKERVLIANRIELEKSKIAAECKVSELENVRMLLIRNIAVLSLHADLETGESEIAAMRTQVNNDLTAEIGQGKRRLTDLRDRKSRMEGELAQLAEQIRSIEQKRQSPLYREIDAQVQTAWIRRETAETAVRDLQRYHTALDKALMKYHVHKMSEINAAIATLWHSVYHGNDIDCIAIRSDVEDEGEAGKRSYNYRVVLINGDVELDMRGRCSAGQKVLASIIIRLALAESFCHNCGILALDEPTTNLDKANIQGLAAALCKLIESRRNHRNFQLIVITHDEEFVRVLSRLQVCDTYYRVTKDSQGYSRIRRNVIHEIQ